MNQTVFNINFSDNYNLCLYKPSNYKKNEQVTVSSMEFYKRLTKKIGEFIDDNFNWNNVIIAGGLISGMIEKKADMTEYQMSDIDIFVYGKNKEAITNKIQYIYDYFSKKLDKKFYSFIIIPNTVTMNIVIPGKTSIQIIGTLFESEMEVLDSFDMTHCQIGFNGDNVIYTKNFIQAIQTKVTKITKKSIHAYRLVKANYRGYSIHKTDYCFIKNMFHEYTNDHLNTDKIYAINNLDIDMLIENPIVVQNLTKNYIPPIHDKYTKEIVDNEMKIIGESYAGKDKYLVTNDYNTTIYMENISDKFSFLRMPFVN